MEWNFDMDAAPANERVLLAFETRQQGAWLDAGERHPSGGPFVPDLERPKVKFGAAPYAWAPLPPAPKKPVDMDALVAKAKAHLDAMTPEERQAMWTAQRESWARGQAPFDEEDRVIQTPEGAPE